MAINQTLIEKKTKYQLSNKYMEGELVLQSPTFLAPGTGFVEDNFSSDGVGVEGWWDGWLRQWWFRRWEQQMKLYSLAHCSPLAWFLTGRRPVVVLGPGAGDPWTSLFWSTWLKWHRHAVTMILGPGGSFNLSGGGT